MSSLVRSDELERLDLPAGAQGGVIRYFRGDAFGVGLSLLCVDIQPGHGAPPHVHVYDELFLIHAGRGRYTIGDETVEAGVGDIVVVPAGLPHGFVCVGPESLRQTSVHRNATFAQTVLERGATAR